MMEIKQIQNIRIPSQHALLQPLIPLTAILLIAVSGCISTRLVRSAKPVRSATLIQPGNQVMVNYTCRLKSGEIVSNKAVRLVAGNMTDASTGDDASASTGDKVSTSAADTVDTSRGKGIEQELSARLARAAVGLKEGQKNTLEFIPGDRYSFKKGEGIIKIARVRKRPKMVRMTVDEYTRRMGRAPLAGQEVVFDPSVPGRVSSVTETEVVVLFSAKPDSVVDTPLGRGVIREKDEHYEIVIDAGVGKLVRTGSMIGRVAAVDEDMIAIDFSDPFEGKPLVCEFTVKSVDSGQLSAVSIQHPVISNQEKEKEKRKK